MIEVGVTAWRFGTGGLAHELASQAEQAESMGISSFWLPENHFGGNSSIPSPLMLLAAVAARTHHIKLGSSSYLLPIRHPIQAAEEVAVLDRMSGGRVILGVGRGFQDAMFTAYGVPAKEKRKRFRESLTQMIAAWQGEPIAYQGSGEEAVPIYLAPQPVQEPHPAIWVAAFGPLAIKQAASFGLPYLASPVESDQVLIDNYQHHSTCIAEAGLAKVSTVPIMRTLFISESAAEISAVKEQLAQENSARRGDADSTDDWSIVGDPSYARDRLSRLRDSIGLSHLIARGRIAGITDEVQLRSLEHLLKITSDLR